MVGPHAGVIGFVLTSSSMLILNKLSVDELPRADLVLWMQTTFSALFAFVILLCTGELPAWSTLLNYLPASLAFLACCYANMKILQHAGVGAFIIVRASTPLCVSVLEWLFLERDLPTLKNTAILVGLLLCLSSYAVLEADLFVDASAWIVAWYVFFCFDQIYIKHIVDSVVVDNNWQSVLALNLWCVPILAAPLAYDGLAMLPSVFDSASRASIVGLSCVAGASISYFSLHCRKALSATMFTVVGNACKIITILLGICLGKATRRSETLAFLFLGVGLATQFRSAPKREPIVCAVHSALTTDEEDGE